jgi:hypothetical protein
MDNAPLTAADITALRTADYVSFHQYDGIGKIVANAHGRGEQRIYTAREQKLFPTASHLDRSRVMVVDSAMHGYTSDDEYFGGRKDGRAYASVSTPSMSDHWQTLVSLLRAGDVLTLRWSASNNTDNHKSVGFHADELRVLVRRGDKVLTFLVDYSVGPYNSARMIQPA